MDVLAHSAGTLTAQEYAVAHPGRVRRMVLVTPVGRAAREPDAAELAALRASRAEEPWYQAAAAADAALWAGGLSREAEVMARARMVPFSWHRWSAERRRAEYVPGHATSLPWLREAFYDGSSTEPDRLARLAASRVPVLVIAGASDGLIGTAPARLVAATYPDSRHGPRGVLLGPRSTLSQRPPDSTHVGPRP